MEGGFILETSNPYMLKRQVEMSFDCHPDFTVKPEDYTFVDARDRMTAFDMLPYSLREEVIEGRSSKFFQALTRENEMLSRQISLMNSSFKCTNRILQHYLYCTRSNNWLKRHGYPMRRKVKR